MYNQASSMDLSEVRRREQGFITRVYGWMCFALVVTGLTALYAVSTPSLMRLMLGNQAVVIVLIIVDIALVIAMTAAIRKISYFTATVMFVVYSVLTGLMFSSIFVVYTASSIASTFFVTAGTFAVMSCYGWYTKKDLTGIGHLCFMALIGLIIASIVNIFFQNPMFYWIITYLGVLIFVGLIAYDTQKIKKLANAVDANAEEGKKTALLGALQLYLDFINLFIMLLRIFGDRR